jgi:formylglycine-generating enzyme required for sulfatase activity
MAGALNDAADIAGDVFSYAPNDYGIYCMAGNVNEWVADVYRPLTPFDVEEFNLSVEMLLQNTVAMLKVMFFLMI